MNQEYFTVELAPQIHLGLPLANMGTVVQFEVSNLCPVPGVASFWYGVVSFKGSLLWVLDSDRFFDLKAVSQTQPRKLTAVILKQQAASSHKQVAIVVQQLKGITSIESSSLKPLSNNIPSQLSQCCSAVVSTTTHTLHIIDTTALLQQLDQKSSLLPA